MDNIQQLKIINSSEFSPSTEQIDEANPLFVKDYCRNCINDYDDPQMCKFCLKGSHQILAQ